MRTVLPSKHVTAVCHYIIQVLFVFVVAAAVESLIVSLTELM